MEPVRDTRPDTAERAITSSARVAAWNRINTEPGTVSERKLFALVDAAACVLDHGHRYGGQETARLMLEVVVRPGVALACVRILTGEDR